MAEEVSQTSNYLKSAPNASHREFDFVSNTSSNPAQESYTNGKQNDDKFKFKCFYCGHHFGPTSISMRIGDEEEEDPNDDLVHVVITCGKAFGGCNYSFSIGYPRQMSDSIDKFKAWADWFIEEQQACEAKGLIPKWLEAEYQ